MLHKHKNYLHFLEQNIPNVPQAKQISPKKFIPNQDDVMYKDIATNPNSPYLQNKTKTELDNMYKMAKSDDKYGGDALDRKYPPTNGKNEDGTRKVLSFYNIPKTDEGKPYEDFVRRGPRNASGNIYKKSIEVRDAEDKANAKPYKSTRNRDLIIKGLLYGATAGIATRVLTKKDHPCEGLKGSDLKRCIKNNEEFYS